MAKRVLVIDDEEDVREGFRSALTSDGYDVETAVSGEDGLAHARRTAPDLIFLDLRMPGMDGVETLRRLRAFLPDAPVYIVTAFRREYMDALRRAADEGLRFNVMDKPLGHDEIRSIAAAGCGGQSRAV